MKTERLFWNDAELLEAEAKLLSFESDDRGQYASFDRSVFYPQAGGQPSDFGQITSGEGTACPIHFVRAVGDEVRHYGAFPAEVIRHEGTWQLKVNATSRALHTKCHTAGHLLAEAVQLAFPKLKAIRGYHFLDSPHVEFAMAESRTVDLNAVNTIAEDLRLENLSVKVSFSTQEDVTVMGLRLPVSVPVDGALRLVQIEGFEPTLCGGTHVRQLGHLASVIATTVRHKRGILRIGYSFT